MTQKPATSNVSSLATPSDLGGRPGETSSSAAAATGGAAGGVHAPELERELPPPYALRFKGGEAVELTKDQRYADQVVIRAGERGKTLHPSSQAASWVVLFPRISGSKPYVVPEWLLSKV
ncbi:MAG: hypothetical protein R3F62_15620 [Planctomycetota bacterium]